MPDPIVLPPDAARTIEGLRDTGYEPFDALEDIVDNSIAAGATLVNIRVWIDPAGELTATIADNGSGMNEAGLINAMTYGSAVRQNAASLGKFGLGLKTASTAMCRQFSVVTRNGPGEQTLAAVWDLDFVAERNAWLLQRPEPTAEQVQLLDEGSKGAAGTLVMWKKVDRLLPRNYSNPQGTRASKALHSRISEFRNALALTYLRFLRGDDGRPVVRIVLNDDDVQPWDPFSPDFGAEVLLDQSIDLDLQRPDGTAEQAAFTLRAVSLAPRSELTKEQEERAKIGPDYQGFYVFREGRLLVHGNWLGLRVVDPHLNLARIEFSFDHRLDEAFQIDIKKSRINLQQDLMDLIRRLVQPSIGEAENRYRKNERTVAVTHQGDLHGTTNKIIGKNKNRLVSATVTTDGAGGGTVTNSRGMTIISLPLITGSVGPYVTVQESLDDGLLWRPAIVDGEQAVALNAGHPFYQRVYLANIGNGIAIQGMNFLLWALCQAEWAVITEDEKEHMAAVRREVSRVTRHLANDLPEVDVADTTGVSV